MNEESELLVTPDNIHAIAEYWSSILREPDVTDEELELGMCYLALYKIVQDGGMDSDERVNTTDISYKEH